MRGCNRDFFLNLLLTFLIFLPGMIHALYVCATDSKKNAAPALPA